MTRKFLTITNDGVNREVAISVRAILEIFVEKKFDTDTVMSISSTLLSNVLIALRRDGIIDKENVREILNAIANRVGENESK